MTRHDHDHDHEDALARALHQKVDGLHESPLGLDDVRGHAGTLQHRRRTAIGAGIAAALVIVVPTAIAATGGLDRAEDDLPLATASPTVTEATESGPTESPAPSPSSTDSAGPATTPFDVSDLPTGAPPGIEWSEGRDVHRADGTVVAGVLPDGADGLAPMGAGWVVTTRDDQGGVYAQWIPASGVGTAQVYELDGDLATSPDGEVVAWSEPAGGVRIIQRDGDEVVEMPAISAPGAYDAVAVSSEDCKEGRSTDAGCTVFVNTLGEQAGLWAATSHGFTDRYDEEVQQLTAWSEGGYAGITAFNEDLTTCSAVREPDTLSTIWDTCDHRLVAFSPDGGHLLGVGSVGDGFADTQAAILDAADGTVLVDLRSDQKTQTGVLQLAWEDESHALLVTYADGQWAVVRLGLDGTMEYAVPPRRGSDFERPFFLQS